MGDGASSRLRNGATRVTGAARLTSTTPVEAVRAVQKRFDVMRTLVLNAGYEPLSVVSFRRALVLVLAGKATVAETDGDPVVAATVSYPRPAVIVLHRYVRLPYRSRIPVSRRGVLRRDGGRCVYCGRAANTIDHVLPRSRGGRNAWENLVACCFRCNNVKGDHTPAEMGWALQVVPSAPHGPAWSVRGADVRNPAWDQYLADRTAA